MIGRTEQTKVMLKYLNQKKSVFLAVTGRRRVGKTYMIDHVYKDAICFRMTGIQSATISEQLTNFSQKLQEYSKTPYSSTPNNWQDAFAQLKSYLQSNQNNQKKVIFLDELPWINTHRSGFLKMLAHFWNDFLSKEDNYVLIVCGSATSWVVKKLINNKGGLHNRIKETIYLPPFTLKETKAFLKSRNINLTNDGIANIYMAMGGIPYYLEYIEKGDTPSTAIERIMFNTNAPLKNEYTNLYKALFENAENHEAIVEALATSRGGISRTEILIKSKISAGGPYTRAMSELILSGFVKEETPYGKTKRGTLYKLVDEYSIFYHKFIKSNKAAGKGKWTQMSTTQPYKIWTGYAFELLVMRHIDQVKSALGISGVYTEMSSFRFLGDKSNPGFQIDIVIKRADRAIHLCECKFYAVPFVIDKKYANTLALRKQNFVLATGSKEQILTTFITNHGIVNNPYANEYVDSTVALDDLF